MDTKNLLDEVKQTIQMLSIFKRKHKREIWASAAIKILEDYAGDLEILESCDHEEIELFVKKISSRLHERV